MYTEASNRKTRRKELQAMMPACADLLRENRKSLLIVFEGLDASGKSGCIKRLLQEVDMKQYHVHPTAKPKEEEYAHHYLWRFWRQLPAYGEIAVFDRSWYGRVLVERIEELCRPDEWRRAYHEINAFEKQLFDDGNLIVKLWLEVSEEEQLRRFQA
ncbi:MAG: polyphosphate kinase 2 family protein, partial [Eubacteriales bacterium]